MSSAAGEQNTEAEPGDRDRATQLRLLPAAPQVVYRVARSTRGPLDAPPREGAPDASWSRYDVPGKTVYLAETAEGAYTEVLASVKRRLAEQDPLAADAAALGMSTDEFLARVDEDWTERQHMDSGHLPSSWRIERLLYQVSLPTTGWWVDIEHPDSIAAAGTALESDLAQVGLASLTVAALRGEDRRVTTTVARWAHDVRLTDNSTPIGIAYASKHGTGRCWAYWLPLADPSSPLAADDGTSIAPDDEALRRVTDRFRIRVW